MLLLGLRIPLNTVSLIWSSQWGSEGVPSSALVSAKPVYCFLGQTFWEQAVYMQRLQGSLAPHRRAELAVGLVVSSHASPCRSHWR